MNKPSEPNFTTSATQDVAATLASEALVMVVDDEELVFDVTRAFLESAGFTRLVFCSDSPKAYTETVRAA